MRRTGGIRRKFAKPAVVIVVLVVAVLLVHHAGVFDGSLRDQVLRLDALLQNLGGWAPLMFILVWIGACVFLLPGLPISIVGGLVFGALWGSVWTTVGANLGAAAAFLIARYAARDMVVDWVERHAVLKRIDDGVRSQGWRMLVITRLVPIFPFNLQNFAYGLTDIRLSTFVLVSIPTMLPATLAFNFAAGSAREVILNGGRPEALTRIFLYLAVAAVSFVLLSLVPGWVQRRVADKGLVEKG
jgi:uncharacterized membrane protein YdjX (TVP38/TMEM64 family)